MGDTAVASLAQALFSGGITPSYIDGQYWQPPYKSTPELLNKYLYVDDSTAQGIASLLGGAVFKAAPTDLGPNVESAPLANWVKLADGNVLNAAMATGQWLWGSLKPQQANIGNECQVEDLLALNVPGGTVSDTCRSWLTAAGFPVNGPGAQNAAPEYIPAQAGVVVPPAGQLVITQQGGYETAAPEQTYGSAVVPAVTPATNGATAVTPAPTPVTVNSSGAATPTQAPIIPVNSSGAQPSGAPAGGGTPATTTDWTSIFTEASIGGIPNWVWLAGAAVALMAFSSGGSRR